MPKRVRHRASAWCFTIHDGHKKPNGKAWDSLKDHAEWIKRDTLKGENYIVFQWEKGEETGRIHLQGYIAFKQAIDLNAAVARLKGANVEKAKGNAQKNRIYCSKEDTKYHVCQEVDISEEDKGMLGPSFGHSQEVDISEEDKGMLGPSFGHSQEVEGIYQGGGEDEFISDGMLGSNAKHNHAAEAEEAACGCFFERGDIRAIGRGARTDMLRVAELAKTSTIDKIIEEEPTTYMRYGRNIDSMVRVGQRKRAPKKRDVKVIVIWGDSGAGKTEAAVNYDPDNYFILDIEDGKIWWDGYNEERTLIIDEFTGSTMKYETLMRYLDRQKLRLPVKGGHTWAVFDTVIITSNHDPKYWYNIAKDNWDAPGTTPLKRRITKIYHVTGVYEDGDVVWDPEMLEKRTD